MQITDTRNLETVNFLSDASQLISVQQEHLTVKGFAHALLEQAPILAGAVAPLAMLMELEEAMLLPLAFERARVPAATVVKPV